MNAKRGFAPLILLAIVAVIAIGGGAYYYSQKPQEPEVKTDTQTTTQSKDWKLYKNDKYGIEFKYPQNYFRGINENEREVTYAGLGKVKVLVGDPNELNGFDESTKTYTSLGFQVEYSQNTVKQLQDAYKASVNRTVEFKPITMDGKTAYSFTSGYARMGEVCEFKDRIIDLGTERLHTRFSKCKTDSQDEYKNTIVGSLFTQDELNLENNLAGTFKFNSSAPQQTQVNPKLKTYVNATYGFKFNYPLKYNNIVAENQPAIGIGLARQKVLFSARANIQNSNSLVVNVVPIETFRFSNTGGYELKFDQQKGECASNDAVETNNLKFNGWKGCYISDSDGGFGAIGYVIPDKNNSRIIVIQIVHSGQFVEAKKEINSIIETFQFTSNTSQVNVSNSNDFTFKIGDSYAKTKAELITKGWYPARPTIYDYSSGLATTTPILKEYPEFQSCGSGRDAICNALFDKNGETRSLNVHFKENQWIVVGNE
jgi:hypothetical protein